MKQKPSRPTVLFMILFVYFLPSLAKEDPYDYYDNYYSSGNSYYDEEPTASLNETSDESDIFSAYHSNGIRVQCSQEQMTLTLSKKIIPEKLEVHLPNKGSSATIDCVEYRQFRSTIRYRLNMSCRALLTTEQIGSQRFYRHEVLLARKGAVVTHTNPHSVLYTLLLECQQTGINSGNGTYSFPPDVKTRAERRLFEHRFTTRTGLNCKRSLCPYASLCLSENLIDGYYCICESTNCKLKCPADYYGCGVDQNDVVMTRSFNRLRCISNGWLCDKRFDCPFHDDEDSCREVWSTWGEWSNCSKDCSGGQQQRRRRCDISFTKDPNICKLYRTALGCSRRCSGNKHIEIDSRLCHRTGCSEVTCDHRHMIVVIPREPDMTSQLIRERMLIGQDPKCRARFNESHVIFSTLLHKCNTTMKVEGDTVTYSNIIKYSGEIGSNKVITRDIAHSYTVTCRFNRRRKVSLQRNSSRSRIVAALSFTNGNESSFKQMQQDGMVEHLASGDGDFEFMMDMYKDFNFKQRYEDSDYPLHKRLHEVLYVGIQFNTVDEGLTVMIDRCIATPTKSTDQSQPFYPFIDNGCAVDKTVEMYMNDINPKLACFSIETFKFSDENRPFVYFQCDVTVCDVDDVNCRPNCSQAGVRQRERRDADFHFLPVDEEKMRGHVMLGPIIVKTENDVRNRMGVGNIQHRRIVAAVSHHEYEVKTTEEPSSLSKQLIWAIIGGICCLLCGVLAGILIGRKFKRKPEMV